MNPDYAVHPSLYPFVEMAEAIGKLAIEKVVEHQKDRRYQRRRRVGATLRPGGSTPLWNGLRREVRLQLKRRGDQVKLARVLGLPRQRVNSFLTAGSEMPDAERTLELLSWLIAVRQNRPPS